MKKSIPPTKLKIAHVSLGTSMGGMEKLLVEFARHTEPSRFELHFICLQERGRLANDIETAGWGVTALDKSPGFKPMLIWKLSRLLRKLKIDVVHTHNTAAYLYGIPAAKLARIRRTIHTRHGQRYDAPKTETNRFRRLSFLVDQIVSVSNDSRELTIAEGIDPAKAVMIWNGIDIEKFPYSGPDPEGPAVLVARLSPEKNVECLLRSVSEIVKVRPDFRLEIAGDGACRAELEQLSESLELADYVTFLGETRDIRALLARASLFVLPSLTEGVSLTLLEAMARGLPIVATDVGGNPEVVLDGETGLIVPSNDPLAMAKAIVRMMENKSQALQMGNAGRERVEQYFDIRRMVHEYEQLYVPANSPAIQKTWSRQPDITKA